MSCSASMIFFVLTEAELSSGYELRQMAHLTTFEAEPPSKLDLSEEDILLCVTSYLTLTLSFNQKLIMNLHCLSFEI